MKHNIKKISALLATSKKFSGDRIYYFEEIESTNSWLLAHNKMPAKTPDKMPRQTPGQIDDQIDGKVCMAERQTYGKGRRGKSWMAPAGSSVLISMGWGLRESGLQSSLQGLSLVSGLAVAQSLREVGVAVKLKWPNDIIADGKKLGGILVEISGLDCVIGVGINVNMPPSFARQIDQPCTDLYALGWRVDRDQLVAAIVLNHEQFLSRYRSNGFASFRARWNALHAYQNQVVEVVSAGNHWSGTALGVDAAGALLVECNGSIRRIIGGEVSIRAKTAITENDYKMS
ncbi:biotin--[acetyl-CoA-carboxylase] ligase [Candidatus Spongiihabitans sp.]|uniref:biotin--[acetyl-CoA-carboxylase] ligase n=1 Tax=Candidatus Spongiihabitans sp. TaxID=3101308 RepID=UPI003C7EA697